LSGIEARRRNETKKSMEARAMKGMREKNPRRLRGKGSGVCAV
jgi:hypothetical protein